MTLSKEEHQKQAQKLLTAISLLQDFRGVKHTGHGHKLVIALSALENLRSQCDDDFFLHHPNSDVSESPYYLPPEPLGT